jgi:hypothetical protein
MYNTIHTAKAQVSLPVELLMRDVVAAPAKQLGVSPRFKDNVLVYVKR